MGTTILPQGWAQCTLGDLGRWASGGTPSRGDPTFFGGLIPWIKTGDLDDAPITKIDETITEAGLAASAARVFPEGTLLMAMYGATIGKLGVITQPSATNQACGALLAQGATTDIIPFFFHYLKHRRSDFQSLGKGGAQPNISQSLIKATACILPPLQEQRRIVAKVESVQARSRRAVDALGVVPALLDRLRHSILAAAFRGDLSAGWRARNPDVEPIARTIENSTVSVSSAKGRAATERSIPGKYALSVGLPADMGCPPGWKWVALSRVAALESGHTPSREHSEFWNGNIPWIGIRDAREHHGRRIIQTIQTITQLGIENSAARILPSGTVCLSRTASVGYVVIMGRPMATSQDFANWVCSDALVPEFLAYLLQAEAESLLSFGQGSTHTTIYYPEIKALHACLPPVPEQRVLVRMLDIAMNRIAELERISLSLGEKCISLDELVLAKAFRGDLVPQDPNDEPASILLERLRAEAAVGPVGPGRRARAPDVPKSIVEAEPEILTSEVKRRAAATAVPMDASGSALAAATRKPAYADAPAQQSLRLGTPATNFVDMPADVQTIHVHSILLGEGPLEREDAVRRAAELLRDAGQATFKRLRRDGTLATCIDAALAVGLRQAHFDRPRPGTVRALASEPGKVPPALWRRALLAALAEPAADDDAAVRAAAAWSQAQFGLDFQRLRTGGHIDTALRAALADLLATGEVTRDRQGTLRVRSG